MHFIVFVFPFIVFVFGAFLISSESNARYVGCVFREASLRSTDRQSLNQRIQGYKADDVERHWNGMDRVALGYLSKALKLDLLFPVLYSAALFYSLYWFWRDAADAYSLWWLFFPPFITWMADWCENVLHMGMLREYRASGHVGSDTAAVASRCTQLKLVFFGLCSVILIVYALRVFSEYLKQVLSLV